jgi:hypothetical protein
MTPDHVNVVCIWCDAYGQLPIEDGVVQPKTCWQCKRRLETENKDWKERP